MKSLRPRTADITEDASIGFGSAEKNAVEEEGFDFQVFGEFLQATSVEADAGGDWVGTFGGR